jgi:hypothetical protein
MPIDFTSAQEGSGGVKIYSGYLHQYSVKKASFWQSLFGSKPPQQEKIHQDRQCAVEFVSQSPFSQQSVSVIPDKLSYLIKFKDLGGSGKIDPSKENFEKFTIKIYTKYDDEYTIDPDSEGNQVGVNEEHHIYDSYLIYLILGSGIDHLEVTSATGRDKYLLDKLEILENK